MKLDKQLSTLPSSKTKSDTLLSLFGTNDIIPMWIADMDFEIAQPIQDALAKRITHAGFGYEYKPSSFFRAQKDWYQKKYQLDLNKDHIFYSPSITTSLAITIEKLTSEKDGIIIQPPVFMEFGNVIRKLGRRIIKNPLKLVGKKYEIDFENLADVAKEEHNKVLILCNPHNPVGRVWRKEELQQIVTICAANNLLLISDEIHKDIILFGNQFTSVLTYTDDWENIMVCTSEAKTFNLCSISDSIVIIPNEDLRKSIVPIFKKYNLGSTNALTRVALEAAYTHGDSWLADLIKTIEKNVTSIEKELTNSKINLIKPEGTYQIWLDFSAIYKNTKEMLHDITHQSGIAMNAGHWFGREGALFMRMNIGTSKEKVVEAIKAVKKGLLKN